MTGNGVTFENDATGCCGISAAYFFGGNARLTNSTVVGSGGASSIGGGIHNARASLTLVNDTLSGNVRGALETNQGGFTSVANTIIGAGLSDGGDGACVAANNPDPVYDGSTAAAITQDLGHNLDQDGSCGLSGTGDITGDPHMASIADNGGATRTQALLFGSPARRAGDPQYCPTSDQRGFDVQALRYRRLRGHPGRRPPTTARTYVPESVSSSQAQLVATINLDGEAEATASSGEPHRTS